MSRAFESQLNAFRRRWQSGLLLEVLARVAGLALVAYAAYSLLDFLLGFEADTRFIINTFGSVFLGGFAVFWLVKVLRYSSQAAAIEADKASGNKRRTALSALELQEAKRKGEPLSDFLLEQSVLKAVSVLESIPSAQCFPRHLLWSQSKRFALQAAILLGSVWLQHPGAPIVLERILHPSRDVPPFTGMVFTITPETPQITYGGDATINVTISGKPVKSQVYLLTRSGSSEYRSACFQEGPGRYAQKLEKVIQPVEFAFATGRARSLWHKVDLLLQPKIARAEVTIIPPAYTGRPKQSNLAGKAPLVAFAGSQAIVTLTSNRPLKEGSLQIHPANDAGIESVVAAEPIGPHTVSFKWIMRENAELNFTIRDVRGTPNGAPFHLAQQVTPDQPPQAVITEPGAFALATPDSVINLCGYAEDDVGLSRVDLVRTMVGFRDRSKHLGPDTTQPRLDFSSQIELRKLGVSPGQTLEFYAEAADTNPSLMGIGNSAVCRIEIISTENYAQMIRDRTTLEEFAQRYEVLSDQLEALAQALKKLEDTANSSSNPKAKEAALKDSQEKAKKAAELFNKMAGDFPAFDSDKALSKAAGDIGSKIQEVQQKLGELQPSTPDLAKSAQELNQELGNAEQEMQEQKQTGQEIAAVSRVMETVAEFQKVVLDQAELERQLNRIERSHEPEELRKLPALSERQKEVAKELKEAIHELSKRRAELPKGYESLDMSASEFLAALEPMNVPQDMESGSKALDNQNAHEGARLASVALEKLQKMLSHCKGMGGMCQGEIRFKVPDPLNQTMRQMLQSLLNRATGTGQSGGAGEGGFGTGSGESGESMGGNSSLNTPVFGPMRVGVGNSPGPFGNGAGPARGGSQGVNRVQGTAQITNPEPVPLKSKGWPMENVPEKYRKAVKQYFSQPEDKP